jgi:two-component system sensor kinase FixL
MTADDPGVMPAPLPRRGMTGERTDGDLLFRAVVGAAIDVIIVIDRSAIRSANRATERLFGYSLDELIGYNVNMLMPEPYAAEHDGYIANYLRTGEKKIIGIGRDVAGRRKDGAVFPMYLAVAETHIGGERIFVGIVRDVSDREAAELARRESELRVRSILDTVPDGIVVIDDRGMIQSFSPAAERLFSYQTGEVVGHNLSMLMPQPYREAHDGYLERYRDTGERRIIGIGRVVVGRRKNGETIPMEPQVGEFSFAGGRFFTGFVCDLTEQQEAKRRIQDLQAELPAHLAPQCDGPDGLDDGLQIQQVMLNLVRNAVAAMQAVDGRELVIATRAIMADTMAEASVIDTGQGIRAEISERLFQPFVTTKASGTGLGLSICREIVEAHHGQLSAAPNPSGGTVFRIMLPITREEDVGSGG